MSEIDETMIRRHPNGAIDTDFYRRRAAGLRTAARTRAVERLIGALMRSWPRRAARPLPPVRLRPWPRR